MAFLPEECACARVAHQRVSFGSTAQDSLGKNVSKELSFWLWGKNNQRYANSGCSLFFRGSNGVSQVCLLTNFYKQDPVWRWICTLFNTERWSSPSYKRSRPWFKTADGELNSIKGLCFVGDCASARHSLAPPMVCLQELGFFGGIVKLYISFINMIKLKTFWRYEGWNTTLYVLKINMWLGETVCVMSPLSWFW